MSRTSKDIDVEIHGMGFDQIVSILSEFGAVDVVGARFGVIKVHGVNADFSVPRRDNRTGVKHTEFTCSFDQNMSVKDAAMRRDITINSMAMDTVTGEIVDCFGGISDIQNGIIRHTSSQFCEDSTRVMRIIQFASRFGFSVAPETAEICQSMVNECQFISKEPMWTEWVKFTKGMHPSKGMQAMIETGWFNCWPEVAGMVDVAQDATWHPEGDVWTHTMQAIDVAAAICDRDNIVGDDRIVVIMGTFCHDMGKSDTTVFDGSHIVSPGHPESGSVKAEAFMRSIGAPEHIVQAVASVVREHMFHISNPGKAAVGRFIQRMAASVKVWAAVVEADHSGRGSMPKGMPVNATNVVQMAAEVGADNGKPSPIIMGRHMIEFFNMAPGPHMGRVCRAAFDAQMSGEFSDVAGGVAWVAANM